MQANYRPNPDTVADIKDSLQTGNLDRALQTLLLLAVEGFEAAPPPNFSFKDIVSIAEALCKVRKESRLAELHDLHLQDREKETVREQVEEAGAQDWLARLETLKVDNSVTKSI
tara:strand:- start:658 stop:999 length:342 start_codon:yes stop_codon:yes gene_type:complete